MRLRFKYVHRHGVVFFLNNAMKVDHFLSSSSISILPFPHPRMSFCDWERCFSPFFGAYKLKSTYCT